MEGGAVVAEEGASPLVQLDIQEGHVQTVPKTLAMLRDSPLQLAGEAARPRHRLRGASPPPPSRHHPATALRRHRSTDPPPCCAFAASAVAPNRRRAESAEPPCPAAGRPCSARHPAAVGLEQQ